MRLHRLKKILIVFLVSIVGLLLISFIFINLPSSHRFITNRVNRIFISANLPIHIGSISTIAPGSLYVHNLLLTGSEKDTIIFAENLKTSFKTFALLKKKVILPSVELENARIFFYRDDSAKSLNISEAFIREKKITPVNEDKVKKAWEVSVGKAELSEIRFRMTDSVSGIYINQYAGHILIETEIMSLIEKTVIVRSLELDGATGSITMNPRFEAAEKTDTSKWNIGIAGIDLKNINFIFDDQQQNLKLDILAGEIKVKTSKTDLKNRIINIENADISSTSALLQMDNKTSPPGNGEKVSSGLFPWDIAGEKINLQDVSFRIAGYSDSATTNPPTGFSIIGLGVQLSDLQISNASANADIKNINFDLGNGFSLKKMSGKLDSHSGTTLVDLSLETRNSKINIKSSANANLFELIKNPAEIRDAKISLNKSTISLADLLYFKPEMQEIPGFSTLAALPISLNGDIVKNDSLTRLTSLSISQYKSISLFFQGEIRNIFKPDLLTSDLKFRIEEINNKWLNDLLKDIKIPLAIPHFNQLTVNGALSDSLKTPHFNLDFKSDLGNIDLLGSLDFDQDSFIVKSTLKGLRLGNILNTTTLGLFSGSADIKGKGIRKKSITAEAILIADSIRFNDYDYTKSRIDCEISPGKYDLIIKISDPSLELGVVAKAGIIDSVISASVNGHFLANLKNLHLFKDTLVAEGTISVDFRKQQDEIESGFALSDLNFDTPDGQAKIKKINASFRSDSLTSGLSAQSDFFNADIKVEKSVRDLGILMGEYLSYIKALINPRHTDSLKLISSLPVVNGKLDINYNNVFRIFIPDSSLVFRNISCSVITSLADNSISYGANMHGVVFRNYEIENLSVSLTDSASILDLLINADTCTLASEPLNNIHLSSHFSDWKSLTNLSIKGRQENLLYNIEIGSTNDTAYIYLTVPSKQLILNGYKWQLDSEDVLKINRITKALTPSLRMQTGNSFISFNKDEYEGVQTFNLGLGNVVLTSLYRTEILPGKPMGNITGSYKFSKSAGKSRKIVADLQVRDLNWSDLKYKEITLKGSFSSDNPDVYDMDVTAILDSAEIKIKGYKELKEKRNITAQFKLIPVNTVQPFVQKFITDLSGYVSGDFNLSTKNNTEALTGELLIEDVNLKVNSLNSSYRMPEDRIRFADKKMIMNKFRVLDSLGHQLVIDGSIDFRNKNSVLADLEISSSDLQVMNRPEEKNSTFYGSIFIDTKLSLKGPVTSPMLKGKIALTGGTDIYFRQKDNLSLSESEKVLTFVSSKVPSGAEDSRSDAGKSLYNKTSIESIVEIDPATRLSIELSKKMFNIGLVIKGGGELNYVMQVNNQVNLSGKYEVSEGSADLKMIGWPNKSFKISKGGFIRWDGILDDPELQFEAINKVTSSYVNPLDNKERYVNFDVTLKLSNRLSAMDVQFTLNTTDQYIMSIINTLSPEEQMRQAITILLFENVDLPGISTTSNYMSEQVNQLVASQLNALTKTTIKGIDISFGIDSYVQANASGGQETKTSLSYEVKRKLMNDRAQIELSGRINDGSSKQTSTEMSLNNVSFEYRLDSAGTKFLKVYNEHTYEDVFEGEVIKTGVGITYRKNYPKLGDIWKKDEETKRRRNEKKRRKDEETKRQSDDELIKQNSQDR